MSSAIPGLNEPYAQKLSAFRCRLKSVPAVFAPPLFTNSVTPYTPQPTVSDEYLKTRLISEVLSAADSMEVRDERSYIEVSTRTHFTLFNRRNDGTLSHMHTRLMRLKAVVESPTAKNIDHLIKEIADTVAELEKEYSALNKKLIVDRLTTQRFFAGVPAPTLVDLNAVLELVPAFQASYLERLLSSLPHPAIPRFYRALYDSVPYNEDGDNLSDILLRRYERFVVLRVKQAERSFRALILFIAEQSRLGDECQVLSAYQKAEDIVKSTDLFSKSSLFRPLALSPVKECWIIWETEKSKILPTYITGFSDNLEEIFRSLGKNQGQDHEKSTCETFITRNEECISLNENAITVSDRTIPYESLDTLFYCTSLFKIDQNEASVSVHHWGFRTFDGEEIRIVFSEESEWQAFAKNFKDVAFVLLAKKRIDALRNGIKLKFKECRIGDFGIEIPQKQAFWGQKSHIFYPWKDVFLEFSSDSVIVHAGENKAYINTWVEPYITTLIPLLRNINGSSVPRLSSLLPLFLLKSEIPWK